MEINGYLFRDDEELKYLILRNKDVNYNNIANTLKFIEVQKIDRFVLGDVDLDISKYLSVLYMLKKIKYLFICNFESLKIDWTYHGFTYLKHLVCNKAAFKIDFKCLPEIEFVDITYSEKNRSLFDCKNLKTLVLHGFKGKNLNDFNKLILLENLELISSSIENLDGVENLENLKKIELHRCSKLNNLSSLNLLKFLEIFIVANLNSLKSLNFIRSLNQLIGLSIRDCKNIEYADDILSQHHLIFLGVHNAGEFTTLKPIIYLKKIKRITLGSTTIIDGDVSPILELKTLEYIQFANSKKINYSLEFIKQKMNLD